MPMNSRLLRPIASGVHPEAAAWRTAVIANGGGTPSASTMRAVSKLCADIQINGLRSKIRRLNPMAGGNLNAALVPLYKSTSATGSLIGNATDTNNNFVSGDYSESSGLVGNANNKTLMTGVAQNYSAAKHLAVFAHTRETGSYFRTLIGCADSVTPGVGQVGGCFIEARSPAGTPLPAFVSSPNDAFQQVLATGTSFNNGDFLIGTTTGSGANNGRIIVNGTVQATATGRDSSFSAATVAVFAMFRQSDSTYQNPSAARLGGYSIGDNLTDTEAATYSTIWDTFLKALGRR
jgi:hypothetical protein